VAEAGRDTLTQLFNRKFLPVVLAKEVQYARKTGSSFSALMLEVDDFQRLHAAYGRACSDALIQQVAQLLGGNIHGGDYLFRLSEAEFCMVLVDTLQGSAMQLAEKVRVQVAREVFATGQGAHKLTLSVGVAAFDEHPDYQRILKCSEEALRQAKAQGGNRVVLQA